MVLLLASGCKWPAFNIETICQASPRKPVQSMQNLTLRNVIYLPSGLWKIWNILEHLTIYRSSIVPLPSRRHLEKHLHTEAPLVSPAWSSRSSMVSSLTCWRWSTWRTPHQTCELCETSQNIDYKTLRCMQHHKEWELFHVWWVLGQMIYS